MFTPNPNKNLKYKVGDIVLMPYTITGIKPYFTFTPYILNNCLCSDESSIHSKIGSVSQSEVEDFLLNENDYLANKSHDEMVKIIEELSNVIDILLTKIKPMKKSFFIK